MKLQFDYRAEVETTSGVQTLCGSAVFRSGENRLVLPLPQGRIRSITASAFFPTPDAERIFMNGYQTWTCCPEYSRKDRIRGLHGIPKPIVEHYALNRYGDYDFVDYPNRPGATHGVSYCYFRSGARLRLLGSLDETPGYTMFRYDAARQLLTLRRDCAGLVCGGDYHAFDLYLAEGDEDAVFDGWFAAMRIAPRTRDPLAGYSSWYNRYDTITEFDILHDLESCRLLLQRGDLFQIDDGWERAVGDWLPHREKFPGGMKRLADRAHDAGFLAGLWLAPFSAQADSRLFREHPDWMLQQDGKPFRSGCNWGGFYALDIDKPEVVRYLEGVFACIFDDWGYDLVKLDFLYCAAPFGTDTETRAARMQRAMRLLRRLCGGRLLLGCGVPLYPAFGLADYCRIGCDVSLDWDDKPYMRLIHRERVSTRQAILNSVFRRELDGRAFGSDPDVFLLRDENCRLTPEEKQQLGTVCALFGSVFLTSDDPSNYTAAMRREYKRLRRLRSAENVRVEADGSPLTIRYSLDGEEQCVLLKL